MQCSNCKQDNPTSARFCSQCGAPFALSCPACGVAVSAEQKFCMECGQRLQTPAAKPAGTELGRSPTAYTPPHLAQRILATRHAVRGEKKQVTVLFCDVVDSTVLARDLGPEAMHELLSNFFEVALSGVHHHEGTVNQFLGDGFMAIFGAPLALEDHAARAALAALAIRNAVTARRAHPPIPGWERLQVRMGINSGQVVVGAIGDDLRMDYTAVGNTTNLAARLQSAAAPDEILCGETTLAAARDAIQAANLGPVLLKGHPEPVARQQLLSAREVTSRTARRRSAFVGRGNEFLALHQAVERARDRRGGVFEIEGEPGVGKSRLMMEFLDALGDSARVVRGHCVTYGRQAPNAPIAELARALCGIGPADDAADMARAIEQALVSTHADDADFLGALIGLPQSIARISGMDPATARGRTTQALAELVGQAATEQILVLVIEDLHWADASSMEYLVDVSAAVSGASALLVTTFRPGPNPSWSAGSRLERIRLAPLDRSEGESLVRGLPNGDALSDDQLQHVLARGEGNPFFLEELLLAPEHGSVEVPGDVTDVIGARIDRLDPDDKDLLRTAAVIGRGFDLDLVEDIAALRAPAQPNMERLMALGFLEPTEDARRFRFVHALTQEVAYDGMLSPDRRRWHTAVAERQAERAASAEQACEEIARHHLLGNTRRKAIPFLELAVAKAIRGHALEAAHGFFNEALGLLEAEEPTPENVARRIALVLQEFPVFHFTHRNKEYAELIERYFPIVEEVGASALRGPFLAQRGHRMWVAARYDEAVQMLEEAVRLCDEIGDPVNAAYAEFMLSWSHDWRGEFDLGEHYGNSALCRLEAVPVPLMQTYAYVALLLSHVFRGRWSAALDCGERAREVGVRAEDDGLASFGGAFWSFAALASGDANTAIKLAKRAMNEAPTHYFRDWASAYLAAALCRIGEAEQALPVLEQATELAYASAHISGYLLIALLLAEARLIAGQNDRARELAEDLHSHAETVGMPFVAAGADLVLGELALMEGRPQAACERFRAAGTRFEVIHAENALAQARFGEGRALVAQGASLAARSPLEDGLARFERLGTLQAPMQIRGVLADLS